MDGGRQFSQRDPFIKSSQQTWDPVPHHGDHRRKAPIPIDRLVPGYDHSTLSSGFEKKRLSIDHSAMPPPQRWSLDQAIHSTQNIQEEDYNQRRKSGLFGPALAVWDAAVVKNHEKHPRQRMPPLNQLPV